MPQAWLWSKHRAVRMFWWCVFWGVGLPLLATLAAWDALRDCLATFPMRWRDYANWPWLENYSSLRAVWRGKDA